MKKNDLERRKYLTYKAMTKKLTEEGIKQPGTVTSFLLDGFMKMDGCLKAEIAYAKGICVKGSSYQFDDFKKELTDKNWICWELIEIQGRRKKTMKYWPGANLRHYLNQEKIMCEDLATKRDVDTVDKRLTADVEALKEEVDKLKKTVDAMINLYDPPVTEEKREKALTLVKS
jgi:hypothetical protein